MYFNEHYYTILNRCKFKNVIFNNTKIDIYKFTKNILIEDVVFSNTIFKVRENFVIDFDDQDLDSLMSLAKLPHISSNVRDELVARMRLPKALIPAFLGQLTGGYIKFNDNRLKKKSKKKHQYNLRSHKKSKKK